MPPDNKLAKDMTPAERLGALRKLAADRRKVERDAADAKALAKIQKSHPPKDQK